MRQNERKPLIVWDVLGTPEISDEPIVFWSSVLGNTPSSHSIPRLVEENAGALRARYLALIHDLGGAQIKGRRLVDHLQIRPGFSYWWMHLLTHKANAYASPRIVDAIKMMAFEDLAPKLSFSEVVLVSENVVLAEGFRKWCVKKGLGFKWRKQPSKPAPMSWPRKIYHATPKVLQAFFELLRSTVGRWLMRNNGVGKISKSHARKTFVSYFLNLDQDAMLAGRFKTGYWTALHDVLEREAGATNWMHKYIYHAFVPSTSVANRLVTNLNKHVGEKACHTFIDSAMGFKVIARTISDYFRLVKLGIKLRKHAVSLFQPKGSDLDLWLFFKEDWDNSMHGAYAMRNCLDLNLSEAILKILPPQEMGFYLQENQAWEMAYIHAWKSAGHGELVGVPHSTVRFWDLRYFYDPRAYQRTGKNDLPLPDKVALNGQVAVSTYSAAGYPVDQIAEVEALRYLYLDDVKFEQPHAAVRPEGPLRVLVLGDYLPQETRRQLEMLNQAALFLPKDIHFSCKPHPACPIDPKDYPGLSLHVTNEPLGQLLGGFDLAYTSNITSAAVDAWCAGVPVVSVLDGKALNLSPLRGLKGVAYVAEPEELAKVLLTPAKTSSGSANSFFYLDKKLPRWKSLIGLGLC